MSATWNISRPVASEISSVDFTVFTTEDILGTSVKQIVNPLTFDETSIHIRPNEGGLYDPALGACSSLGTSCSTCNLDYKFCPGHMGHIALPVPVYHPIFFDQMFRLLKATCIYCFRLRMAKVEVNRYANKLQLLQHGLVIETYEVDAFQITRKKGRHVGDYMSEDENDPDNIMDRRNVFVREKIKQSGEVTRSQRTPEHITVIEHERRQLIREFLKGLGGNPQCNNCTGYSPGYRRDGFTKIFEKRLDPKKRDNNIQKGLRRKNVAQDRRGVFAKKVENVGVNACDMDLDVHDEEESENTEGSEQQTTTNSSGRLLSSMEVRNNLHRLFENESDIFTLLYQPQSLGKRGAKKPNADMFFMHAIAVPPTRFRPPAMSSGEIRENAQNSQFAKILTDCFRIRDITVSMKDPETSLERRGELLRGMYSAFTTLQDTVNALLDSTKSASTSSAGRAAESGIKQMLEKKEGLFRMNMMGKRVNYAARSVISPDPNIEPYEIGVPPVFAKKLTYPEPVTMHNFEMLKACVENGPEQWPGASYIEMEDGSQINLRGMTTEERSALASQLLTSSVALGSYSRNKKVHRHVRDGDIVLMNRQPTLHKPSMMAHYVKVLPGEKTIRMHYANCNTYNADFDGDEMNLHLPQSELARAEAYHIANTNNQYLVATSGKPLRGLIQDHLVMGVWISNRDTMFTRDEYQQLLYSCLRPEDGNIMGNDAGPLNKILTVPPTIIKPVSLWTGKQVITTILHNICRRDLPGLTMSAKSKIGGDRWGSKDNEEGIVLFHRGYYVHGILDKNHLGPTEFGFIHSVYEVYGAETAGRLLGVMGRLLTKYLHMRAFTCGMDDLLLTPEGNRWRREKLAGSYQVGKEVAMKYVGLTDVTDWKQNDSELNIRLENVLRDEKKQSGLDLVTNSRTKDFTSSVIAACLPTGLVKPFPVNHMQTMTVSGAKGSDVNSSQISCLLGQQTLEGRRVPVMVSGKSLPCFRPYETNVRAGGYIADRFLTGIRPQEYYFHCMAGREGLIDTAVKTSRSGYLQRCLIKGMESVRVEYDNTVRDSDGSIVQFLYGEDGLDVAKQKHLSQLKFCAENSVTMKRLGRFEHHLGGKLNTDYVKSRKSVFKKLRKTGDFAAVDPIISLVSPAKYVGAVSEKFSQDITQYCTVNPDKLIMTKRPRRESNIYKDKALDTSIQPSPILNTISEKDFYMLMSLKYQSALVDPGEAVGIVAGQSIGEPSTQMTLNTFHLAGHSTKNVTLGIPRLREIVMTASANIATPTMTLTMLPERTEEEIEMFRKNISRLTLAEITDKVIVTEKLAKVAGQTKSKTYLIRLNFFPKAEYEKEYCVTPREVVRTVQKDFLRHLSGKITTGHKKKGEGSKLGNDDALPEVGTSKRSIGLPSGGFGGFGDGEVTEDSDSEGEDADGDATASKQKSRKRDDMGYDDPDEGEEALRRESAQDEEGGREDSDEEGEESNREKKLLLQQAKAREEDVKETNTNVYRFAFDDSRGEWCEIGLEYPASAPKLLMINLVEKACVETVIHQLSGIRSVTAVPTSELAKDPLVPPGTRKLVTDGVNFPEVWEHCRTFLSQDNISSNDIAAMLRHYGVEAARATIVQEMKAVFGSHGISVDSRHLNLIADVMTRGGGYTAFNRIGISDHVSPFLKMSFETTCKFLTEVTMEKGSDDLKSPSGQIVLGKVNGVGTGSFDVLVGLSRPSQRVNAL